MSGGKQTPRQKMIGMMYLVLTALLALNVSAEILNAFILIDTSLTKTGDNFQKKNEDIYTKFQAAFEKDKNKVKPYKDLADEVNKASKALVDYMTYLQVSIVQKADGPKSKYRTEGPKAILAKDDNNIPAEIMILKGRADSLKLKMDDYHKKMDDMVNGILAKKKGKDGKNNQVLETMKVLLSTADVDGQEGNKIPWRNANFEGLPLAAVTAMLSKMKADVRNVESDVITFLLEQIDAASFKFNKLEAIVKANKGYLLQGEKYEAEVFIAAFDTTQEPDITLNGGGKLATKGSKGIYTGGTTNIGPVTWGGVIKVKAPGSGEILEYPFKGEYIVATSTLSISPDKLNVFFVGIDNPVTISAAGIPSDRIVVNTALEGGGSITPVPGKPGKFNVRVKAVSPKIRIPVSYKTDDNQFKSLGEREFKAIMVPDPVAFVGKDEVYAWPVNSFIAYGGVKAYLKNFEFANMNFTVVGFSVSVVVGGLEKSKESTSAAFTTEQMQIIRQGQGKKVRIEDIYARGEDGVRRKLGNLTYKLQ